MNIVIMYNNIQICVDNSFYICLPSNENRNNQGEWLWIWYNLTGLFPNLNYKWFFTPKALTEQKFGVLEDGLTFFLNIDTVRSSDNSQ